MTSAKSGILFSTAGVFGSALLWLLSFKMVAYWLGPAGVGLFSQLRQIAQAATVGATFGGTNVIVQGLSARSSDQDRKRFRSTAIRLMGGAGILVALLLLIQAPRLTRFFLSSDATDLVDSVRWVSLAVLLNVGGTYAMAVLNGYRSYPYLALAQIAGPMALVAALFAAHFLRIGYHPQMLALLFVLCFGVTSLVGAGKVTKLPQSPRAGHLSKPEAFDVIRFAFSSLLAALSATAALLVIRSWIIEAHGLAFAGLFDAGWTLTFNYTTLFLTAFSTIYLPLLTGASGQENQKNYMLKAAYMVLAGSSLVCYSMVLGKTLLIRTLYSQQFEAAGGVLVILCIAVIFRGLSWVYGTLIIATRNSRVLLASDWIFNFGLLLAAKYCLQYSTSLEALGWAFVVPNFLYLVFVIEYACHKNSLMRRRHIWPMVAAATLPLLLMATHGAQLRGGNVLLAATGLTVSLSALHASRRVPS